MILMIFFILLICLFVWIAIDDEEGAAVAGLFVLIASILVPLLISYNSYLDLREYKDSNQLAHDIKSIEFAKSIIVGDDNLLAETKDGYYKPIIDGIGLTLSDLKDYNNTIISKRIMANNIFLSWYIIEPDSDMQIIKVDDYDWQPINQHR